MGVHGRQNTIKSLEFNAAAWKDGRWEKPTPWQERGGYGPAPHSLDENDGNEWICSFRLHTFRLASKIKAKQKGVDRTQNVKYPNQPYLVES